MIDRGPAGGWGDVPVFRLVSAVAALGMLCTAGVVTSAPAVASPASRSDYPIASAQAAHVDERTSAPSDESDPAWRDPVVELPPASSVEVDVPASGWAGVDGLPVSIARPARAIRSKQPVAGYDRNRAVVPIVRTALVGACEGHRARTGGHDPASAVRGRQCPLPSPPPQDGHMRPPMARLRLRPLGSLATPQHFSSLRAWIDSFHRWRRGSTKSQPYNLGGLLALNVETPDRRFSTAAGHQRRGERGWSSHYCRLRPVQAAMTTPTADQLLDAMRASLLAYEGTANIDPLDRLVGRLSGLLDALVGQVNSDWLEELRSAWWPLEYINAAVLGDDRVALTDQERVNALAARDEFLALLVEQ